MGSSILSEVDDTSILRTGLSICYWCSLARLSAYRLLTPRSGLERSDFVLWHIADHHRSSHDVGCRGHNGPRRVTWRGRKSLYVMQRDCHERSGSAVP